MTSSPNALRLYIVRHGETEWSLSSQHTSRTEIDLTKKGEEGATQVGNRLRGVCFSHVFSSPRLRAQRTCFLAALPTNAEIEPDLTEWDYGDYEGRRSVEIRQENPDWNIFIDGCPHGETPAQVSSRADRLITELRALRGNIALFSHGQFSCVLAARWIGLSVLEDRCFIR